MSRRRPRRRRCGGTAPTLLEFLALVVALDSALEEHLEEVVLVLALEELFEETAIWTLRSIYAELSSNRLLEGMLTLPNAGRVVHLA